MDKENTRPEDVILQVRNLARDPLAKVQRRLREGNKTGVLLSNGQRLRRIGRDRTTELSLLDAADNRDTLVAAVRDAYIEVSGPDGVTLPHEALDTILKDVAQYRTGEAGAETLTQVNLKPEVPTEEASEPQEEVGALDETSEQEPPNDSTNDESSEEQESPDQSELPPAQEPASPASSEPSEEASESQEPDGQEDGDEDPESSDESEDHSDEPSEDAQAESAPKKKKTRRKSKKLSLRGEG